MALAFPISPWRLSVQSAIATVLSGAPTACEIRLQRIATKTSPGCSLRNRSTADSFLLGGGWTAGERGMSLPLRRIDSVVEMRGGSGVENVAIFSRCTPPDSVKLLRDLREHMRKDAQNERPYGVSLEATTGFEPVMGVLQTPALPLGYVAR
jgi:hypothetical protein